MNGDEAAVGMVLSISPEPTPTQRDAIVAALVVLTRRRALPTPEKVVRPTRWQATARREGISGGSDGRGWSS